MGVRVMGSGGRLEKAVQHLRHCDMAGTSVEYRCEDCQNAVQFVKDLKSPERAGRMVLSLHQKVRDWWKGATKLEAQGKKIPAASMRRRMQGIGWILRSIEREMGIDPLEMEEANGSESG